MKIEQSKNTKTMTEESQKKQKRAKIKKIALTVLIAAAAVEAGRLSASKEEREKLLGVGKKIVNSVKGIFTKKTVSAVEQNSNNANKNRNSQYNGGYRKPRFNN